MAICEEAEVARFRAREIAMTRERLRVAVHRCFDRMRLAHQALAARQHDFWEMHRAAAEAHASVARNLRARLCQLERRHATRRVRAAPTGPR